MRLSPKDISTVSFDCRSPVCYERGSVSLISPLLPRWVIGIATGDTRTLITICLIVCMWLTICIPPQALDMGLSQTYTSSFCMHWTASSKAIHTGKPVSVHGPPLLPLVDSVSVLSMWGGEGNQSFFQFMLNVFNHKSILPYFCINLDFLFLYMKNLV